ncbi:MAG TPA: nucleotidyltransferase domain-containing protein [Patescibacteria group bacterium]
MDELKRAIKKTQNYADIYGQKLNDKQLFLRLISKKIHLLREIEGKRSQRATSNDWQNKLIKARFFTEQYLSQMRGILMVGVTGSVATELALKKEDIDLLIVTKKDELWWWRIYLRFLIWWHKIPHRKFGRKEVADEFCFNLWLDEDNLSIPIDKRNLKNATDLIMMKVIWEKDNIYYKFLKKNEWVKNFLATGFGERIKISRKIDKKIISKNRKCFLIIFNKILFIGQYLYMRIINKQKPKRSEINLGQAFFHKNS